ARPPPTLEVPAPLPAGTVLDRTLTSAAPHANVHHLHDIAVSVTDAAGSRVYLVFGRLDRSGDTAADAGLFGEYFQIPAGVSSTTFPNYDVLAPAHTRVDAQVNFPVVAGPGFYGFGDLTDRFAVRWTGQIFVANAGDTRFYLGSDDDSRLFT